MTKENRRPGIIEARIIAQAEIAGDIFRIVLQPCIWTGPIEPGQFINLYMRDRSMLLPRPVSVCNSGNGRIELVYRVAGKGTKELSLCNKGDTLRISTPLGHGYDVEEVIRTLTHQPSEQKTIGLVAGGLGIPPMVQLAKSFRMRMKGFGDTGSANEKRAGRIKLIAMLGYRHEIFLTEELSGICDEVHVAAENGAEGFHGNVLDMMEKQGIRADYYLACGPRSMLKELSAVCASMNLPLQVSLEERMGCGYGACLGCTCKTRKNEDGTEKINQKKVCKDGPVFYGNEVFWDE